MLLLVPADPLRPRRVDEHFAAEATAAREAGLVVTLIDHDALAGPGDAERAVARVPDRGVPDRGVPDRGVADGSGMAVYRGWMLSDRQYVAFTEALASKGVALRTSAAQYRQAHELPGWYPALAPVTPETAWTDGGGEPEFRLACARLGSGPAVLRDYVKSMKHYWHEAVYIPDLADHAAAWKVAARFRELREDDFTGGYVLRRFEPLAAEETRTWWVDGTCRLTTPHPDTPDCPPSPDLDLTPLTPLIRALALPFVTVDLAQRTDGAWRVIELGDAQVSDRPTTTDPSTFLTAILP